MTVTSPTVVSRSAAMKQMVPIVEQLAVRMPARPMAANAARVALRSRQVI
jgi:hypothetical protein